MSTPLREIKILSIVGARPNFIKIASIEKAVRDYNVDTRTPHLEHSIVHTGQHYDERMSALFFDELALPRPSFNLEVGSASHAVQTAQIMERFEPILLQEKPDVLLLVGDVNSTVACALVAAKVRYNGKPESRPFIAHVEAGLRSFDRDMPEEINRILTDALSDFLFTTEEQAQVNLEREGIARQRIHFVGNAMIDTLVVHLEKARSINAFLLAGISDEDLTGGYGVATLHRPSNVDDPQKLSAMVDCLRKVAARLPIVFPLHPRTKDNLQRSGLYQELAESQGMFLTEPLGYLPFLKLMSSATLVLTDSGGIQEETTFLQVPCITLRNNTERPVTVTSGTNLLVGDDPVNILQAAFSVLDGEAKKGSIPSLWDGKAGSRIVDVLAAKVKACLHG
jgi:UDP-N-acetylglucosamine 2-epimerase (non-hydrolysing)